MRNFKQKILAGLLGGALIFSGAQTFAAPPDAPWQEEAAANRDGWAKYFAERYGIDAAQIEQALNNRVHIEDIKQAAILAKLSGKNFSDVLAMKVDWDQVAEQLGVSREQLKTFREQERDEMIAKRTGLDINTYKSLLKDGYRPRDIDIAARIAKAANKNVKDVLGKRKINNSWKDVAKSYGVDMKTIMPPPPGHHRGERPTQK